MIFNITSVMRDETTKKRVIKSQTSHELKTHTKRSIDKYRAKVKAIIHQI